jgi:hypothetical protein
VSRWLDPLRSALACAETPVVFFFRDDDAGWSDGALRRLLDVFDGAIAPVDLAAIPIAVSPALARLLAQRHRAAPALIRVHQHGFAHANHEPVGRKCEFGPARPADEQRADVAHGRRLLQERLAVPLDPIFTPPWNRCAGATIDAVRQAGIAVLSRESEAERLACNGVRELNVCVDWLRRRRGVRVGPEELGATLARAARFGSPVGVMLHHAVMDADDLARVAELLRLLRRSPAARFAAMHELAGSEAAA